MNEPDTTPVSYRVVYSAFVRNHLLSSLIPAAKARGIGAEFRDALKEIDRRLHVYPQFGEPLQHGKSESLTVRIMSIGPLCAIYACDEELRLVFVSRPLMLLPVRRS